MKSKVKVLLAVLFLVGFISGTWQSASAAYPDRSIEIIVPFGVGGGSDTLARAVVEGLKPHLKVPLVVTNMPGGGGTKGMLYVSQKPADGYTVLAVTPSHLIDAANPKTRSHILRDFDPLARLVWDT